MLHLLQWHLAPMLTSLVSFQSLGLIAVLAVYVLVRNQGASLRRLARQVVR